MKMHGTLLLIVALFGAPAFASGNSSGSGFTVGNGGASVICHDEDTARSTAEAFDLYEGRALFGYHSIYGERTDPLGLAYELADKVDRSEGGSLGTMATVRAKLSYIASHMVFLPPGTGLTPTDDSKEFIVPKNCQISQTINFRDNLRIYVDGDIWERLPVESKAALYLHEAIYWQLRELGVEKDSRRTRRLVALLMAGGELRDRARLDVPEGTEVQYCHSVFPGSLGDWPTRFFAYKDGDILVLQFLRLSGYRLLGRTILRGSAATGALPIDPNQSEPGRLQSWIKSPPDTESFVRLDWGDGKVTLESTVETDLQFSEEITCTEGTVRWKGTGPASGADASFELRP